MCGTPEPGAGIGGPMKARRAQVFVLMIALVVPFLPARGAVAGGGGGGGVETDAFNAYFVALNADIEDFDERSASDFTNFNDQLRKVLSNSAATARAFTRQRASVDI